MFKMKTEIGNKAIYNEYEIERKTSLNYEHNPQI